MKAVLICKNKIYTINLPKNVYNSYWITDNDYKIIQISGIKGSWGISSNNYTKIINPQYVKVSNNKLEISLPKENIFVKQTIIQEDSMYVISLNNDINNIGIFYCTNEDCNSFAQYRIIANQNQRITIGSNMKNNIIYKKILVSDLHAEIYKKDRNTWYIKNYDKNYGTFVNNLPIYNNEKKLFNGDVVFIMGLKFILINDNIYINTNNNANINLDAKLLYRQKNRGITLLKNDDDEDEVIEDPKQENYFFRGPRLTALLKKEKIKIDPPPQLRDKQDKPMWLMMGSSVAMGIVMVLSLVNTLQNISSGSASIFEIILSSCTTLAMLIAIICIPFIEAQYEKKAGERYEQKRHDRYKKYLDKKRGDINKIKVKRRQLLYKNYLSAKESVETILSGNPRLWERKISDYDFLKIRIGIGDVPSDIEIDFPEEGFSMEDDKLLEEARALVEESELIKDAPMSISLIEKNILAMMSKDEEYLIKFMKNIIIQLIAFQSYADLKLVFFLNESSSQKWQYVKMLPHVWDNKKQIRFFADDYDDMKEISNYLEEKFKERATKIDDNGTYKDYVPYYLIITDDYKNVQNLGIIQKICKINKNMGFSLLCLDNNFHELPNECRTFIEIDEHNGKIYNTEITEEQENFKMEPLIVIYYENIVKKLANIPIMIQSEDVSALPQHYTFLEMYNVTSISQLDIKERWTKNDPTLSLGVPIGIDNKGNIILLDLHEKSHGPHGLVAGATGSGKSEFIITYILSLAINYHPNDVTFLLIDYKGGGLAGAFQKNDIKLPHLVGVITNIERNELQRSLISIQSELRRRQILFNKARSLTDEGTIDIYKYQKLYHNGVVKEPISHLLIICDEFAELKQQQPDFMDELISVSRIGRSLGVHLILATQKPAGIVNDQIRSNSKFSICFKVQDTSDSQDVINTPDAAYLKNAGQFYMNVGNGEYYVLGQAGWAGAPYFPNKPNKNKKDNSIEIISNIGTPIKKIEDINPNLIKNYGEQLTNIVKYLDNLADIENITTKKLWLDNIPGNIYLKDLKNKYNMPKENDNDINVVIGEYDDPFNQKQGLLQINLLKGENLLIYGNAKSGKETLLSTIVYDVITTYKSEQVQLYILDFGSEALKIYANAPHVGDVIFLSEEEKLDRFFEMIQKEIKTRKKILSDYNGDYNNYIQAGKKMPLLMIMLNNYETYEENYDLKYDDIFLSITREGVKCGMFFVITASASGSIKYRLTQNFAKKIALQLNNEDDYYVIIENAGKKRPSHIFGRGLIALNNNVYEFQTAKICEEINYNTQIEETIKGLNNQKQLKAPKIATLPNMIKLQDLKNHLKDISSVPLGMVKKDLSIYSYDFTQNFITMILSKNIDNSIKFTNMILQQIIQLENIKVKIIDAKEVQKEKKQNLEEAFKGFLTELEESSKKPDNEFTLCVIINIDKFISTESFDDSNFDRLLGQLKDSEKCGFIIIENVSNLTKHRFEEWYKNNIKKNTCIWIGKGLEEQDLIMTNYNRDISYDYNISYGYILDEGETTVIKLVGMKDSEE